jgi:predicted permease
MTELLEILNIVLPVFLVIGIGYVLGASGFIDPSANSRLSKLVFYVAAPALLFRSAAQTPFYEALNLRALLVIAGVTVLVAFLVYALSGRASPSRRGVLAQGAHRSNMVFVGLPIAANAFGPEVLGPAAVMIGFMVVVYNFLAVVVLVIPHRKNQLDRKGIWTRTALKILKNPLIIASGAGLLFSALQIATPVSADRTLELLGRIAMPLALIAVGADLDFGRLRTELRVSFLAASIKLIAYPALVYIGLSLVGLSGRDLQVPVLVLAAPTAVVSCIMAREMKGDEQLAAAIVIGTTIASLFTVSGWLACFRFAG